MHDAVRCSAGTATGISVFGAVRAAGGAGAAAAGASSLVLLAASYDRDDGKDGCREDEGRKHERDGKPCARQGSKERVCRAFIEYPA